ncbi:MAG TPA: nucleotidyltransferase domain-containing protein [Longimicrobiales bacterium]|nr:nucleotidyltransferase domain-containing protein [Longimicrobiales bacterium]
MRSHVLRWPDADTVIGALTAWAQAVRVREPAVRAVGYFGSYARGDWGPGSDLDVIIVRDDAASDVLARAASFDLTSLPVPADLLVYTPAELAKLEAGDTRFADVLRNETRWIVRAA